jgi:putative ABC transport system permease protein
MGMPRAALDGLSQDIRHAARALRHAPWFSAVAVLTLAVAIGINTAVFSIVDSALFAGFRGVAANERLVYVTTNHKAVSYPDFVDWRAQARSFEDMALVRGVFVTLSGGGVPPNTYFTTEVTANTFALLGARPLLGRDFTESDQQPGAPLVVMLRYDVWRARFAGDPSVVGSAVVVNGAPATIVGVMPEGFSFPESQSLWIPMVPAGAAFDRVSFYARYAFGRLRAGQTIEQARAELTAIASQLALAHTASNGGRVPVAQSQRDFFIG